MGALTGLKVLDLSRVLAGPWCSQILADMGADVIKIERPKTGDDTRMWGPPWMLDEQDAVTDQAGYFQCANRNKSSVAIDMSSAEGQALLHDMVKDADVVIENFKVGALAKYGLDYETLQNIQPKLIYCSITGYGQTGPRAKQPGYDFVIQGLSGLMSITGEADHLAGGGPQKVGVAVVDLQTGLYAATAILAALWSRDRTGQGQHIDLALFDVQLAALANQGMNYLLTGNAPKRLGNAHPNIVPYQTFDAKDKAFIIACGNDKQFKDLCHAIGRSDLLELPDYSSNQQRVAHRDRLIAVLAQHFLTQDAEYWVSRIDQAQVPVGMINNIAEALAEPQVQARDMVVNIPHPQNKDFKMVASPIKFSKTPIVYPQAPPALGQHTFAVLQHYRDQQQLQSLLAAGVLGSNE
ncbi:CaiB/BaiF CoA transferase family protein [Acinetobacter larvae]|uniref:CoA transferase n=1 Tax=Acinetobacter larvae TaxID=1789224 RepID=A0A1B2M0P3_9GAMM|nr:CaiB/BaiF CoA-transferase family protein [Acinetobacter larvae]AOA58748.1 CoA transferase [Acinetobacter larvae]